MRIHWLTTSILAALLCSAAFARGFEDIPLDHPDHAAIQRLVELGITEGYDGKFHPKKLINRYQLSVLVKRTLAQIRFHSAAPGDVQVDDVSPSHWASKAIQMASLAVALMQGMERAGAPPRLASTGSTSLPFDVSVDHPDLEAVRLVLGTRVMERLSGGEFGGNKLVNRVDFCRIFHRVLPEGTPGVPPISSKESLQVPRASTFPSGEKADLEALVMELADEVAALHIKVSLLSKEVAELRQKQTDQGQ